MLPTEVRYSPTCRLAARSQIITLPSSVPLASRFSSRVSCTDEIGLTPPRMARRGSPVAGSHSRTTGSGPTVTSHVPLGLKNVHGPSLPPPLTVRRNLPFSASQTLKSPPLHSVTSWAPSGL